MVRAFAEQANDRLSVFGRANREFRTWALWLWTVEVEEVKAHQNMVHIYDLYQFVNIRQRVWFVAGFAFDYDMWNDMWNRNL